MTDTAQSTTDSAFVMPTADSTSSLIGSASPIAPPSRPCATVIPSVIPSDCGCGGNAKAAKYVYVIGDRIGYDFGSRVRQLSLEANAFDAHDRGSLSEPAVFLRYLFGFTRGQLQHRGNLHEAKSVQWVLYQDGCPRYVMEPADCFCEAIYKALTTFMIDTTFDRIGPAPGTSSLFTGPHSALLRYDCLREYFDCYGGRQEPLVTENVLAKQSASDVKPTEKELEIKKLHAEVSSLMGEPMARASKVAIAGTLANKRATLADGRQVDIIYPELRGMSFWSTAALFESLNTGKLNGDPDLWSFAARVVARLYELARNDGKTPQDRAANWAATSLLHNLFSLLEGDFFRELLGEQRNGNGEKVKSAVRDTAVNDLQIRPATCQESGGEYDVELSLFNVENAFRGLTVIANRVDVSDVVPVTLTNNRVFNKRS